MRLGLGIGIASLQSRAGVATSARSNRLTYINNTNSVTFTLPAGSVAGDLCLIFTSHGYDLTVPATWVALSNMRAANLKGVIIHKVLTSGDISTGTVTLGFSSSYWGFVFGLTLAGSLGIDSVAATNNNSGAASRTVTTDANPLIGDLLILFGAIDVNAAVSSSSLPNLLASDSQTTASAIAKSGVVAVGGAQSATVNYGGSPTGDYQALVAVTAVPVSTLYTNTGGAGNRSASITVTATNIAAGAGAPSALVDGSQADSYWWANATGDGTGWLTFDFGVGASKVVDQINMYSSISTTSHGVWRWEGSNDASAWTQRGVDFTLVANAAIPVPNTTGYRYYRLRHMSGARSQTPFMRELEFKIA